MSTNLRLFRRGIDLGTVPETTSSLIQPETAQSSSSSAVQAQSSQAMLQGFQQKWQQGSAIKLTGQCADKLALMKDQIATTKSLYHEVLQGETPCDELLDQEPYASNLTPQFESLGSSVNEGDDQEIETVLFDAVQDQEIVAEDLWMKASWLSFHEEDASLRFRFSFGVDLHEDVAADESRQHYAALLADAVFPESRLITENKDLHDCLGGVLDVPKAKQASIKFVERIIYFNAPNGGAYLHHDRERGHAGVVFAQLSGQTFWLAIAKQQLIEELVSFHQHCVSIDTWPKQMDQEKKNEFTALMADLDYCAEQLESFANETLIYVINETEEFVQQLIQNGHSHHLQPGDMLLLPQETEQNCCWHSVFSVAEEGAEDVGQALSFAIRTS